MPVPPEIQEESPTGLAERLERATTLLLAASALAVAALVGWGGLVLDVGPLALAGASVYHALTGGLPLSGGPADAPAGLRWQDLGPLLGTAITLLFWWHALSLVAEVVLLVAASLGWLWNRTLRPLWLILDILDSAPFAAPKRLVVATALAGQLLVRSAGPAVAAPLPSPPALVAHDLGEGCADATAPAPRAAPGSARGALSHRVQRGDTLSGIAARYYGHAGYWPLLFEANQGAVMAAPALGLGRPVRLTSPNYLLPGWDLVVPPLADHLEQGDGGELTYVVQQGDTLSSIARRFGVDLDELAAANAGAEAPNGHVFGDPNLIWPGLRLRIRPLVAAATPAAVAPVQTEPAAAGGSVQSEPPPLPIAVPSPPATPVPTQDAAPTPSPAARAAPVVVPTVEPPRPAPGPQTTSAQWPWLLAAGGLGAAALLTLRARRSRPRLAEPESDTELDSHAFTLAAPAAVVAARRGGSPDPHGIVLGEQVAGALVRHARTAGLDDVRVVSVRVSRTGCTVALETPLEHRPRLEATLRTAQHLARRLIVSRSSDQDVVAQLEGIQRAALERVPPDEMPLLLCVGLRPDTRAYLVGWEALGHVLVATQPGTQDACEHLASLVATLAGQCGPSDLQLYTIAPADTLLGELAPLPHQRAVADPANGPAMARVLASLRAEVERRQREAVSQSSPELVLVASELAQLCAEQDLVYVLEHGRARGVRVLAATADTQVQRGPLVDWFESRLVFALEDEEASTRLVGKPWALTLAEPGRLLVCLGRRDEVEILGLHLTEEGRRDLLATVGAEEEFEAGVAPGSRLEAQEGPPGKAGNSPAGEEPEAERDVETGGADSALQSPSAEPTVEGPGQQVAPEPAADTHGAVDAAPSITSGELAITPVPAPEPAGLEEAALPLAPTRIARLLGRAPLVVDSEDAAVWSANGRLGLEPSRPLEVLFYLAAAPLLEQQRLDRWPGVMVDTLLREVWAPGARDPDNRESGQTWLGKTLGRLQEDIGRAAGALGAQELVKRAGGLRLNDKVAVSDVEAFMSAVERARAARGPAQVGAAEEAVALRVAELLPRARMERLGVANKRIELYRWLAEPHWERAARRLEALGREAAGILARAYRDAGRHAEALAVYAQLLGEDPLDRRAQEGLLAAAAGTGDVAQLHEAWHQVCACLDGEDEPDLRAQYEELLRDFERSASSRPSPGSRAAVGAGSR